MSDKCIIVCGGGDLLSGVIHRLHRCGYRVLILECENWRNPQKGSVFMNLYMMTAAVEVILQKNRFSGRMRSKSGKQGNSTYGRSGRRLYD